MTDLHAIRTALSLPEWKAELGGMILGVIGTACFVLLLGVLK